MIPRIMMIAALGLALAIGPTAVAVAGNGCSDRDDAVCDFQVPEPSSLVLLVSGLGALAWTLRRRR